jgi:NAD(P)-dependent dehydrogenase (short-subunit alcohol dehydrogenase family)
MPARLAGRRVVVIGAGTRRSDDPDAPIGNGRAISVLAAREGAAIACVDRDADAARETARLVEEAGGIASVVVGDVADEHECARVVDESIAVLVGIDGLVCNVGIGEGRGLEGTSAAEWDAVFAVNVRAHFLLCRAALPRLAESGAIVFVSSVAGLRPGTRIPRTTRRRRRWPDCAVTSRSKARAPVCARMWLHRG